MYIAAWSQDILFCKSVMEKYYYETQSATSS